MISYFPAPFEDEMIYSMIARYHFSSTNTSISSTIEELFSKKDYYIKCDFFRYSSRLEQRLKHFSFYSGTEIVEIFTFYQYYKKFIDKEKLLALMISESSRTQYELFGNQIIMPNAKYYKFCEKCKAEELIKGVPYWHISHNLPGVTLCSKHKCKLMNSNVLFNGKGLLALSQDIQGEQIPKLSVEDEIVLEKINNETINLFYTKEEFSEFGTQYISYLYELGYYDNKVLDELKLKKDLWCFYSDSIFEVLNIDKDYAISEVIKIMRLSNIHPLFHILFLIFCNKKLSELNNFLLLTPFGTPPFKCKNIACNHYNTEAIFTYLLKDEYLNGIKGIFNCLCGYTYSIGNGKLNTISYGEGFFKYLTELVFHQDLDLNIVCKELNIDISVISKKLPEVKGGICFSKYTKEQFRNSFLNEIESFEVKAKLFRNNNLEKIIIWLKSNDSNWFDSHNNKIKRILIDKYI